MTRKFWTVWNRWSPTICCAIRTKRSAKSRLLMLETIREYAAELLAETAEEETTLRVRHAEFFLDYARQTERDLMGARQIELLNAMEAERDNFRAAMDWWRKTNGENELKLTAALTPLWNFRGFSKRRHRTAFRSY